MGESSSEATNLKGKQTDDIFFGDLNNDGRDDIIVWNDDGSLSGYMNTPGLDEQHPVWKRVNNVAPKTGAQRHDTRLADVTGNGQIDRITLNSKNGQCALLVNEGKVDVSVIGEGTLFAVSIQKPPVFHFGSAYESRSYVANKT